MTPALARMILPLLALSAAFGAGGLAGWTLGRAPPVELAPHGLAALAPVRDSSHFRLLAQTLLAASRFEEAIDTTGRGLAMFPEDPVLARLQAFARFQRGQVAWAERDYLALLARAPNDRQIQAQLAAVQEARANWERRLEAAAAAVAAGGDAATLREARVAHAEAALALARDAEALKTYEAMIAADAADPVARNGAGVALMALGNAAMARNHFAEAVRLSPRNAEYLENLQRADRAVH